MKFALKTLFALISLAAALSTLTFGCSKPADETPPAPQTGNSVAKPDSGTATPPKTHD